MSNGTSWQGRLATARALSGVDRQRDQTELKSAVDSCYFSMYHALCRSNAQALAGRHRTRYPDDWSRVYMGMTEDSIPDRFRQHRPQAADAVKGFGACFAIMQDHRDRAMERPFTTFLPSEVANLIERAESAIIRLLGTSIAAGYQYRGTEVAGHQPADWQRARRASPHIRNTRATRLVKAEATRKRRVVGLDGQDTPVRSRLHLPGTRARQQPGPHDRTELVQESPGDQPTGGTGRRTARETRHQDLQGPGSDKGGGDHGQRHLLQLLNRSQCEMRRSKG